MLGATTVKNKSYIECFETPVTVIFYSGQSVTYYINGQIVNNLGFVSYMVSVLNNSTLPL